MMIDCIARELSQRAQEIPNQINTIYFGGGTPSLLHKNELDQILTTIKDNYSLSSQLEITIESNPDDLDKKTLQNLLECGFNRLSIGIQSFSDEILFQMNRCHSSKQSLDAINYAQSEGFNNISIDLMFGLPNLSSDLWIETIHQAIDLDVQHISCYNLTIEESTALWHFVNKNLVSIPPISYQEDQFFTAHDLLIKNGFNHYEISNYSKSDFESNHNSNYWNRSSYLGVGPSAHSFIKNKRIWNISNNAKYIGAVNSDKPYSSEEWLSSKDQFNEMIMLSLRTSNGLDKAELHNSIHSKHPEFISKVKTYTSSQILIDNGTHLKLAKESYYLCDHYSSDLFIT